MLFRSMSVIRVMSKNKPAERYRILGSIKMTGFGSRIDPKSKPFAWIGDRGTTIYELDEIKN